MSRRWAIGLWAKGLAAASALLLVAGTASAAAASPAPGAFRLAGSNGFEVQVVGSPAGHGSPSQVVVFVSRGRSYATYTALARATPTSFEADLGALGRIDVDYHPTGPAWTRRGTCDFPFDYAVGYYEGTIEFHGEGGYTDASATKVEGSAPDLPCGSGGVTVGGRLPGARLSAFGFSQSSSLYFRVYRNDRNEPADFSAMLAEASGDVGIVRSVEVEGSPASFRYGAIGKNTLEAAVSPPAPFSGSATFRQRGRSKARWKGNLSVDFLGHPNVALIRPETRVSLTLHTRITDHLFSPHNQGPSKPR